MPTITLEVQDRGKAIALLEAALQQQVAHVEMGVVKTRQCLEALERRYGCTLAALDTTDVHVDPLERAEWEGEAEMLRHLEQEKAVLTTVRTGSILWGGPGEMGREAIFRRMELPHAAHYTIVNAPYTD